MESLCGEDPHLHPASMPQRPDTGGARRIRAELPLRTAVSRCLLRPDGHVVAGRSLPALRRVVAGRAFAVTIQGLVRGGGGTSAAGTVRDCAWLAAVLQRAVPVIMPLPAGSRAAATRLVVGTEDQSDHHRHRYADDGCHDEMLCRGHSRGHHITSPAGWSPG